MASARELGLAELDAGSIGRSHPINPSITTFSDFIEPGVELRRLGAPVRKRDP